MTLIDRFSKEELIEIVNSCVNMKQLAQKLGYKSTGCYSTIRNKCKELNISLEHFTGVSSNVVKRTTDNIFIENSDASQSTLRNWYIKGNYTEYKCAICGQGPLWNNKPLTLTLDHINGHNHDNRLENLRWICPNCDRQLDTFCAKNPNRKTYYNYGTKNYCIDCGKEISADAIRCLECRGKADRKVERPTMEQLKQILFDNKGNFSKVGRMFGVNDNSIRKWCKSYGLPFHSSDYKV